MSASVDQVTPAPAGWREVIAMTFRLLSFRASKAELINLTSKHLWFGLLSTWLVGIGRYWDNPRASLLQHSDPSSLNTHMRNNVDSPTIERTLRTEVKLYYDLQTTNRLRAPLLIALHGYGAGKRQMMREALQMAPSNFAIAAPQGIHQHLKEAKEPGGPLRFGFGWLTNFHPEESVAVHHKALLDLIDALVSEGVADRQRVFLLGFSQSCALNYRFAFTYPEVLRGVIGICGGLPGDWDTSEAYKPTDAAVLHLAGANDEFYGPSRVSDYAERLRVRARRVEFKSYEAGHEIVPEMRVDVREWLSVQVVQSSSFSLPGFKSSNLKVEL